MTQRTCKECGKIFETVNPNQLFCNKRCTINWHAKRNNAARRATKDWVGVCEYCGAVFTMESHRRRFCTSLCKERARLKRRKATADIIKKCKCCGKEFLTRLQRQVLCLDCSSKRGHGTARVSSSMRRFALIRQNGSCWLCKKEVEERKAVVHHLDGLGHVEKPNNDPTNLVALHKECHAMFHRPHIVFREGQWKIDGKIFGVLDVKVLPVDYSGR